MRKSGRCERQIDPLTHYYSRRAAGVRQHDGELFASITCHKGSGAAAMADNRGHCFQTLVTSLMTIAIVIELEMVYITYQQ